MKIPDTLKVDAHSPIPIRRQLTEQLKHVIEGGGVPRDEALPSIRQLAGFLAINPNTVARVVDSRTKRRRATILGIVAALVWFAEWVPVVVVVAFVTWALLHTRMGGRRGQAFLRRLRRVWPPAGLILVPLLLIGAWVAWVSPRPVEAKVVPVVLDVIGLAVIVSPARRRARDTVMLPPSAPDTVLSGLVMAGSPEPPSAPGRLSLPTRPP